MMFITEADFLRWLISLPEENFSYLFKENSKYPLNVDVERKPNRVIVKEVE